MTQNPFDAPKAELDRTPERSADDLYAPCPKCGGRRPEQVGFTWWGGMIGARMLTHVRCTDCRYAYNGKTGRSNAKAIAIYQGVGIALAITVYVLLSS